MESDSDTEKFKESKLYLKSSSLILIKTNIKTYIIIMNL